ncbi:MAG: hypothetical protein WD715_13685, partial [Dongiaceae bacterium]
VRPDGEREDKIAAIGVRLRRWVTFHGISINLDPDLTHYAGIVPCGIHASDATPYGVTSLRALGVDADMAALDRALKETFDEVFADPSAAAIGSYAVRR